MVASVSRLYDDVIPIMHLFGFCQMGVVCRIYLGKLFGGSCNPGYDGSWAWIPCVTSPGLSRLGGALFIDLPANVAGSFVMGLLASSTTLSAAYPGSVGNGGLSGPSALAFLPTRGPLAPLQRHTALHLGLRTGFCGSLTTFASWMLQMVEMFVGGRPSALGSEWVAALWGLFLNIAVSLTALVIGQHMAIALCALWDHLPPSQSLDLPEGTTSRPGDSLTTADRHKDIVLAIQPGEVALHDRELETVATGQQVPQVTNAVSSSEQKHPLGPALQIESRDTASNEKPMGLPLACAIVDAAVLVITLFLTAISIGYAVNEGKTPEMQQDSEGIWYIWICILLGPAGCLTRWRLARLNGKWGWFPWGTWAANIGACLIDFTCQAIITRVTLTVLQFSVLSAIMTGISGSLSTVSTWVVEIQTLNLGMPSHFRGYTYALSSMVASIALGLLVYGTAVWTI